MRKSRIVFRSFSRTRSVRKHKLTRIFWIISSLLLVMPYRSELFWRRRTEVDATIKPSLPTKIKHHKCRISVLTYAIVPQNKDGMRKTASGKIWSLRNGISERESADLLSSAKTEPANPSPTRQRAVATTARTRGMLGTNKWWVSNKF